MKHLLLSFIFLSAIRLIAQDIEDPSLQQPYRLVVQTGVALQWFDTQFKSFTVSVERPLNLYNHAGIQANFFFPNDNDGFYYRNISGKSYEVGIFAKCFFHGRLTGRRSKAYIGPDMRLGVRKYFDYEPFTGQQFLQKATTYKFMARVGWQYHLGLAVFEITFPFGFENEKFENNTPQPNYYFYTTNSSWFVAAPALSLGIGF